MQNLRTQMRRKNASSAYSLVFERTDGQTEGGRGNSPPPSCGAPQRSPSSEQSWSTIIVPAPSHGGAVPIPQCMVWDPRFTASNPSTPLEC